MNNLFVNTAQEWDTLISQHERAIIGIDLKDTIDNFTNLLLLHHNEIIKEPFFGLKIKFRDKEIQKIVQLTPELFKLLNLSVRSIDGECHTCITSDEEVLIAVKFILGNLFNDIEIDEFEENDEVISYTQLCREIFNSIPFFFKQLGFEIYKSTEQSFINDKIAEKLARAIHSRYKKLMMDFQNTESKKIYSDLYVVTDKSQQYFTVEFDQLPDSIKSSNIDNAYHIPTKLLSIGYEIRECKSDEVVPLLYLSETDVETMAMVEHIRWSWEKRLNGYSYAPIRNDNLKKHNCLVPYDELTEVEKEKDRVLVRLIPLLLQDIGYLPVALSPNLAASIKYPQRANAKIHHVKHNAEKLFNNIKDLAKSNGLELPQNLVDSFQQLIQDSKDVGAGFTSAGTIQRTYLPSTLYFRECLPDSFLLFKPKDIVSGDFYFVSRKDDAIVYITADCTGHGIQGAMLTAICYNYIDQAVNDKKIIEPAAIITNVMPRVEHLMRRSEGNIENKSGMELAVCKLNTNTGVLDYAGLNRPLYYYSNGQLNELVAAKYRESFEVIAQSIQTQSIQLNHSDTIYTFSDGFADQFGGPDLTGERFKTKRFKELLSKIQDQSMTMQKESLNQAIEQWRQQANQEQTDDIIVIGVKI
ncbi:MAG: hypothetical protein EHM93_05615 [Bacteroidales bacterium]|nr:MAG: hypothetical protein EHM93_05615 [Bacteroidales bacterium]